MGLSVDNRVVVSILVATNIGLLALQIFPLKKLRRYFRRTLQFGTPAPTLASPPQSPITASLGRLLGKDYVPPLPDAVVHVLNRACLCFLATANDFSPHLSLMRFSFCKSFRTAGDEVLILSTRRNTLKYKMLTDNQNVALLVHDFVSENDSDSRNYEDSVSGGVRYSITLNGCVTEETGEIAEQYRAIHLERNRTYEQFIVGNDIAIISVTLQSARVCDVNDGVRHWTKHDNGLTWTETTRAQS